MWNDKESSKVGQIRFPKFFAKLYSQGNHWRLKFVWEFNVARLFSHCLLCGIQCDHDLTRFCRRNTWDTEFADSDSGSFSTQLLIPILNQSQDHSM